MVTLHFKKTVISILGAVCVALGANSAVLAVTFSESGDAGELPGTATSLPGGNTTLSAISGSLSELDAADLFRIFISDAANFSATIAGTGFDTQLFLFNDSGLGIYSNDDDPSASSAFGTSALLPGASPVTITTGFYYLAVSVFNYDPHAAGGLIFPNPDGSIVPFDAILGPTGPGGASPVNSWTFLEAMTATGAGYTIALSGVTTVPEPSSILGLLTMTGFGLSVAWRRRQR
ncbi:MAG: PEP-CTERM sorting domain-containing protein [Gemmatimonadaceae bacterium]|nr:PEP-CTERM sorting domain-containing protein [Gloeobacterales cyanobacterium ES-bin-141]